MGTGFCWSSPHYLGLVPRKSSGYLAGFAGDYRIYPQPSTTLLVLDGSGSESAFSLMMAKRRERGKRKTELKLLALSNERTQLIAL